MRENKIVMELGNLRSETKKPRGNEKNKLINKRRKYFLLANFSNDIKNEIEIFKLKIWKKKKNARFDLQAYIGIHERPLNFCH